MLRRLVTVAIGPLCALIVGLAPADMSIAAAQTVVQGPQGRGMPRDQPPGERKGTGIIRGRVTALDTGRPLRRDVLDGDWHDPHFLESLRESASRVTLREGEAGTVALQVKTGS